MGFNGQRACHQCRKSRKAFAHHLEYTVGKHRNNTNKQDIYEALSFTVRDIIVDRLNETQSNYRDKNPKRVYYLSLEF